MTVSERNPGDRFPLAAAGHIASIVSDAHDYAVVGIAAGMLADDIARVTGRKPGLYHGLDALAEEKDATVVLLGTAGRSALIDELIRVGRLNIAPVADKWESFLITTLEHPFPGVARALVIVGSDRRGTAFGATTLSERIGVSPWSWWADVPVKSRTELYVDAGTFIQGPPAVKYRGIFLNDEEWGLHSWASKNYEKDLGDIGPKTYRAIFELLLRLRANFLWPAMHECTHAFNYYPANAKLADEYAIVMGASHCEQMLRDNVDEWDTSERGPYDYVTNRKRLLEYWDERVQANAHFENVYTLGMRGIHDSGMPGGGTEEVKAARLHAIIADQRQMLRRWILPDLTKVGQIFCPYKEVLGLFRLRPDIPEDMTILWPDDNYGFVRQFSNTAERKRSGGAGVYYHVSYRGGPGDYLWLCSSAPEILVEEMTKAWHFGARTVWMLNVGDIKPDEWSMELFLKLAWNPERWPTHDAASHFLTETAARDFGVDHAMEIAAILKEYYLLNQPRKPELVDLPPGPIAPGIGPTKGVASKPRDNPNDPALAHFAFSPTGRRDEATEREDAFASLMSRADRLETELSESVRPAYYELVLYPVRGAALMNLMASKMARYHTYNRQGRARAYQYLHDAYAAQTRLEAETRRYNSVLDGKWRGMMWHAPHDLAILPKRPYPPSAVPQAASLGVAVQGQTDSEKTDIPRLHFTALVPREQFIDIFTRGRDPLAWRIESNMPWIKLSQTDGHGDARVLIDINWAGLPEGKSAHGRIEITGAGSRYMVDVDARAPTPVGEVGFAEEDRWLVMEAEHFSHKTPGRKLNWEVIKGVGYNGEAMTGGPEPLNPADVQGASLDGASRLDYDFWVDTAGVWRATLRSLPTCPLITGQPIRYAIAVDDASPQIVTMPLYGETSDPGWRSDIVRNSCLTESNHSLSTGRHTLHVWLIDPELIFDAVALEIGDGTADLMWRESRVSGNGESG